MKIWHLADIHFGKIYKMTIDDFFNKVDELEKPDVIVIAGDLYHTGFYFDDPVIHESFDFLDKLKTYCDNIIIVKGTHSHDRNNLKTVKKVFRIFHIIDEIEEFDEFCVIPEPDINTSEKAIKTMSNSKKDILIFHGTVSGAILPSGYNVEEFKIHSYSVNLFNKFKLGLLGHIHMPQKIGETSFYAGSLGRWQFGEEHDKGFLIHDTDNGTSEFIALKSPSFKTVEVETNDELEPLLETLEIKENDPLRIVIYEPLKVNVPKNIKVKVKLRKNEVAESEVLKRLEKVKSVSLKDKVLLYSKSIGIDIDEEFLEKVINEAIDNKED